MTIAAARTVGGTATSTRWIQLVLGLIAMMAISSPQYVWTLFTKPIQGALSTTLPALQVTLRILIVLETWLSPLQGYLIAGFGPRLLVAIGGAVSRVACVAESYPTSLTMLDHTYGLLCGIGT